MEHLMQYLHLDMLVMSVIVVAVYHYFFHR